MKYTESEWLKIHNENANDGKMTIDGIFLRSDFTIASLSTTTRYAMCDKLSGICPDEVCGIKGSNPQFHLEDDGTVSLIVDETEVLKNRILHHNCKFSNEKIIPFSKWFKDYVDVINFTHKKEERQIHEMTLNCVELNRKGYATRVRADITWKTVYGPFGRVTTRGYCLGSSEILIFTYGLARNSICDDWWTDDDRTHCYFNENLDMVYDDCGYYYNSGYNKDFFKKPH